MRVSRMRVREGGMKGGRGKRGGGRKRRKERGREE